MEDLRSLVMRAQGGDLDAYGEIVCRFQDMAFGYAYSTMGDFHLAEDATQEAFIEGYRCLQGLVDPLAFAGWFRRIVFNHCDRLTRRKRLRAARLESVRSAASGRPGPIENAERREMVDKVQEAIHSLPENERTVITLFYINGYSQRDIAEFLDVPVTTVNNRLHASRKRLKERMMPMVEDTLRSNAPTPEEASDQVTFLLKFGERLGKGDGLVEILERLQHEVPTNRLREVIRELLKAISLGRKLFDVFDRYGDLFPPMVVLLICEGERFGVLDETAKLAGQWLRQGKY